MMKTAILDFGLKNILQYPVDVNNGNPTRKKKKLYRKKYYIFFCFKIKFYEI